MPSFDYQKKKKHCIVQNVEIESFGFFHWNKCFCYYTESKVPKKGTVGYRYWFSGTDTGNVPVQMWTVHNHSKFTWTCLQLQEYDAPGVEHIPVVQIDLSVPLKVPGEQIYNP